MEFFRFVFSDFWVWIGFALLVCLSAAFVLLTILVINFVVSSIRTTSLQRKKLRQDIERFEQRRKQEKK